MLILQNISYTHPDRELLFSDLGLTVNNHEKIALIGNNGAGKSTLLKLIAKELQPSAGQLILEAAPYYVPQIFGQYNHLTVAQALRAGDKVNALREILKGNVRPEYFDLIDDDWTIEERCHEALKYWQLEGLDLTQEMETLSGGQKTKVFLAGIAIHKPQLILLDEPTNHLDTGSRALLYDFIQNTKSSMLIVSHDRKLLNLLHTVCELTKDGIRTYGGNYEFYLEQRKAEEQALNEDIQMNEKALRKARDKERETMERRQKLDNRGKGRQEKAGTARIMMNTLRNNAENSTSKLKSIHAEKISEISGNIRNLRSSFPDTDKMKFGLENTSLHRGKLLFSARKINFEFSGRPLWTENMTFEIRSGERIAIKGQNGSGKTTLIGLITGRLEPSTGAAIRADAKTVYIDQDYSLLQDDLRVYEQAQKFNTTALQEHEVKIRLNRFLFTKYDWDKPCNTLSGGERMRLLICCLTVANQSPDIIILDEPTNNLDTKNVEILTAALGEYKGTIIVVSHDEAFLEQMHTGTTIEL